MALSQGAPSGRLAFGLFGDAPPVRAWAPVARTKSARGAASASTNRRTRVGIFGRSATPLQVRRSGDDDPPIVDQPPHDQIEVARRADPDHRVHPLLDRIDDAAGEHKIG